MSWKVGIDSRSSQTRAVLDSKDPGTVSALAFLSLAALDLEGETCEGEIPFETFGWFKLKLHF